MEKKEKDKEKEEKIEVVKATKVSDETFLDKVRKHEAVIITAVCAFIVIAVCLYSYFSIESDDLSSSNSYSDTSKIELKYTETSETTTSGIYITDVSEIVENVMPSIVAITSKTLVSSGNYGFSYSGSSTYQEGAGSGIIISKSDTELMILTNNHVVDGASELSVQFINEKSYDATVVGTSERKDIAVISVKLSDLDDDTINSIAIATIGSSDDLKVGEGVVAIGNALGYGQSVTTGVVSALNREVTVDGYTNKMIQIDAAINGGNSGGALLNSKGEVVGINSVKYSSSSSSTSASIEGMGFAIPISDVTDLITSLMNGEEEEDAPTLGIKGYIIPSSMLTTYNFPSTGFYISEITSDSAASDSDLSIGDIIYEIEGESVDALSDIQNVLYEHKTGDKITLKVYRASGREYKSKTIEVTL